MNKAKEVIEQAKNYTFGTALMMINEAIQESNDIETRLELLVFKCSMLERSVYGKRFTN